MAPIEVIHLMSDSDSEQPADKRARTSLQTFLPRKQKVTLGEHHPPPDSALPLDGAPKDGSAQSQAGSGQLKDLIQHAPSHGPLAYVTTTLLPGHHTRAPKTNSLGPERVACNECRELRIKCQHKDPFMQPILDAVPGLSDAASFETQLPLESHDSRTTSASLRDIRPRLPPKDGYESVQRDHNTQTVQGRVVSEQLSGTPTSRSRRKGNEKVSLNASPSDRPRSLLATELSNHIQSYKGRYGKEALRQKQPPSPNSTLSSLKERIAAKKERRNKNRETSRRHNAGLPREPVLAGANLAIFDLPADTDHGQIAASRPGKRDGPSPIAASTMPPAKRLRQHDQPQPRSLQPEEDSAQHAWASKYRHDSATLSAKQLEEELTSTLPEMHEKPEALRAAGDDTALDGADSTPLVYQKQPASGSGMRGRYSEEDNALLARLKEVEKLSWAEIASYFPRRLKDSIEVHYCTKVKGRYAAAAKKAAMLQHRRPLPVQPPGPSRDSLLEVAQSASVQAPLRRKRRGGVSALNGFVSWSQVSKRILDEPETGVSEGADDQTEQESGQPARQDRAYPSTVSRILRQRELGTAGSRGWSSAARRVSDELKNHALAAYAPSRHYMSTSGDVTCLAWASDGQRFAAGSIAITDDRSMQYNANLNLVVGDSDKAVLQELPQHHVPRPIITDNGNVNALHSMRETQDPRLFMTVAAVGFSPDGRRMYTAGGDKKVRMYSISNNVAEARCAYEIEHPAAVDLLGISQKGLVATACHTSTDGSVQVYSCSGQSYQRVQSLSPCRTDSQSTLPIFPSALKWGAALQHCNYLLAGFSSDSSEEDRDTAGETALWSVETGARFSLSTVTRNVFDVAWNPSPSPASTAFCVASTPGFGKSVQGRRSIVQCYAPGQDRARQVLEWECPAFDINDVMYCPFDDNLIAAGATDGKVYLWDKRFASRNQNPLLLLAHGDSATVLDHDRDREFADTGVRFLSWGATSSRLYSGSSDGVVKSWNPYRAPSDAFVADVATFQGAVMSGTFSPDFRKLLIGEERGRLNLLSIGGDTEDEACRASRTFKLHAVEAQRDTESPYAAANELLSTKQIELRDMGALPVRQAVQGRAYQGPYLKPSTKDWSRAQEAYEKALDRQNKMHTRSQSQGPASEEDIRKADEIVRQAQQAQLDLQSRHDAYHELQPAASALQTQLRNASKRRIIQEDPAGHCKLDCNYFAPVLDEGAGMPDSHRSEQRIPGALRALPTQELDVAELDCKELFEAGLAGRCTYCSNKRGSARMDEFWTVRCRQRCNTIKAELTGTCESCSAPVRKQKEDASEQLCERCSLGCFRCSRPVQLLASTLPRDYSIYCEACGMAWGVGVLGYDLVRNASKKAQARKGDKSGTTRQLGSEDSELRYYHSRWQTGQS